MKEEEDLFGCRGVWGRKRRNDRRKGCFGVLKIFYKLIYVYVFFL